MRKGFTLIELLGVIIIISLLALLTSIAVTKLVKDSKQQLSNVQINLIKSSAEMWGADNLGKLPDIDECIYLKVSDLKNVGLLDNSEKLDDNIIVRIKNELNENGKEKLEYKVNGATAGCSNGVKDLYKDESKANIPSLRGLVPVIYDEEKSSWKIIDPTEEWYDYDEQWWANAVILREDLREEKNIGDLISVPTENNDFASSDVLAMFVWIPRYSYTISSDAKGLEDENGKYPNPGAIDIKFVGVDSKKENGLATYEGDTPSEWYTHPAFTFGDEELSGIWVGKFETSHETNYNSTQSNNLSCTNENCENADGIRILPNVQSLRYNDVSNFFFASRSIERDGNPFGINSSLTDTHMMKNSEWGAVAYLSQSTYGKYGKYREEVYINNCNKYITGIGADTVSDDSSSLTCTNSKNKYNGESGVKASTTGNIYGIYDMSGGAYDFVMGNYNNKVNASGFQEDFFNTEGNSKYYDKYTGYRCTNGECKGHALEETAGWYGDLKNFLADGFLWYARGGVHEAKITGGVFMFGYSNGNNNLRSFHVVLSPIMYNKYKQNLIN